MPGSIVEAPGDAIGYPEAVRVALDALAGTGDSVDHAVIHTVEDGIRIVPF